jgi:hypothetical protein
MRETRINFIIFFTPWVGMDISEVGWGALSWEHSVIAAARCEVNGKP